MAERTGLLFAATIMAAYTIVPPQGEAIPASVTFGQAFVRCRRSPRYNATLYSPSFILRKPVGLRCRFEARR